MEIVNIRTNKRIEWINITNLVEEKVSTSKVGEGLVVVYVPHTTAGITINENADPDVVGDINQKLNRLIPENDHYVHSEGNSDGHIKASLMGSSATVLVMGGRLQLGTWQGIFFCEFDGPRNRQIYVHPASTS